MNNYRGMQISYKPVICLKFSLDWKFIGNLCQLRNINMKTEMLQCPNCLDYVDRELSPALNDFNSAEEILCLVFQNTEIPRER